MFEGSMFGEYAQIASFLSAPTAGNYDYGARNLPAHLLPQPPSFLLPWGWGQKDKESMTEEGVVGDGRSFLVEDFIMVAEFSEIEGPKPVLTIPKDGGESVDLNSLSVKIMAVDHQTNSESGGFSISEDTQVVLSDHDTGVYAFAHHLLLYDNQARGFVRPYCMVFITTDLRKIMMFYEELSSQFKRAARYLKYGNRLLFVKDLEKHLQDLDHTKGYLLNQVGRMRLKTTHTQDEEQNKIRVNAENELYKGLQNIQQSTMEIKDILSVLKPLLHDKRLESRFRCLEERAFHHINEEVTQADKISLQEDRLADKVYKNVPSDCKCGSLQESGISPVSLFKSSTTYTPLIVETTKSKRFNSPLRGLHELCSWGAKEGLYKLRCIHEYFRKDSAILEIERNESRLLDPPNSVIAHGQCITSNFLSGVTLRGISMCLSEDSSSILLVAGRLHKWSSFGSNDTLESFKSVDSYLSLQDAENASLVSFQSNNSSVGVTTSASVQDFISAPTSPLEEEAVFPSLSCRDNMTACLPAPVRSSDPCGSAENTCTVSLTENFGEKSTCKNICQTGGTSRSASLTEEDSAVTVSAKEVQNSCSNTENFKVPSQENFTISSENQVIVPLRSMIAEQTMYGKEKKLDPSVTHANDNSSAEAKGDDPSTVFECRKSSNLENLKLDFSESFKSLSETLICEMGDVCSNIDESIIVQNNCPFIYTPSSEVCLWKPRHGIYTLGDFVNSLGPGRPGYGICEVLGTYSGLQPLLFSLMTGRTVLIVGPTRMETEVTRIVTALSLFLADTPRKHNCVVDWMNRPLKLTDLTRIRLAGICRSEKRSLDVMIPSAVKQYSSIFDVERRVLIAPAYQGNLLNVVIQHKKSFKTDAPYVTFIQTWLMEIASKAFIFYHSFCLGDAGAQIQSHSLERHRQQYNSTVSSLMTRLGVKDDDILIIEHVAEKVKMSQLEPQVWAAVDKGNLLLIAVPSSNQCVLPVGGVRHRGVEQEFVKSDFDTVRDLKIFNMFSL